MINEGYITRDQYEGYINNMHSTMQSCFERFIPDIAPNNIIEQYEIKANNTLIMCCDGMGDWVSKELAINAQNYFDDITAIAVKWFE